LVAQAVVAGALRESGPILASRYLLTLMKNL